MLQILTTFERIAGNVANSVYPTQEFLNEVYTVKNNYTKLFHDTYRLRFPFWDETAAAIMVDPSIVTNQTSRKPTQSCIARSGSLTIYYSLHGCRHCLWKPFIRQCSCLQEKSCASCCPKGRLRSHHRSRKAIRDDQERNSTPKDLRGSRLD